jgi:hypothetical protein
MSTLIFSTLSQGVLLSEGWYAEGMENSSTEDNQVTETDYRRIILTLENEIRRRLEEVAEHTACSQSGHAEITRRPLRQATERPR